MKNNYTLEEQALQFGGGATTIDNGGGNSGTDTDTGGGGNGDGDGGN